MKKKSEIKIFQSHSRFLWFLTFSYAMFIIMAGWFNSQTIRIFSFDTKSGDFIFPITFLLLSVITEVYGYKHARSAIWCGFLLNFIFIFYSQSVIYMPSPGYAKNNPEFDHLLAFNAKIIVASFVSYFTSAFINSFLIVKLKSFMEGHYMSMRFILSNVVAICAGGIIFNLILSLQEEINKNSLNFIFVTSLIMIFLLPLSVYITKKIKYFEKLDIYDKRTYFNIFSFDVFYKTQDNEFSIHRK